ncbi:MAG: DUF2997 domain-containing protein [Synechococcaceae bacterium WB9_2_112]|nr:DUF2997 domain-containing protein [Synechococcaceae bacterium WB9_2_112]
MAQPTSRQLNQQTIRFRIRPDGRVEETVEGVAGAACESLSERIESRVGSVQRRVPTSEAYLAADQGVHQQTPAYDTATGWMSKS